MWKWNCLYHFLPRPYFFIMLCQNCAVACGVCMAWWSLLKWDGVDLSPLDFNDIRESSTAAIISSNSLHICNVGINVILMHMLIAPALQKKKKNLNYLNLCLKQGKTNGVGNIWIHDFFFVIFFVLDIII